MNNLREQYEQCVNPSVALAAVVTPSTTVAELRKLLTKHPVLADVPLSALRTGDIAPTQAKQAPKPHTHTTRKGTKHVDTRTESGRAALDAAVFEVVQEFKASIAASAFASLGASPNQIRSSLNRLIAEGSVTWTGKARGTRYHLAE